CFVDHPIDLAARRDRMVEPGAARRPDSGRHADLWCPWRGSNARPLPYQGSALPLSHMGMNQLPATRTSRAANTSGAGEGNRTLVISLEGFCSTIELHPPAPNPCGQPRRRHDAGRALNTAREHRPGTPPALVAVLVKPTC